MGRVHAGWGRSRKILASDHIGKDKMKGKKEVFIHVELEATEYCPHCDNKLKLAKVKIDNREVIIDWTCPGCDAAYKTEYLTTNLGLYQTLLPRTY